ncbi:MAG TPA: acyl-CoA dehydratase activase [Bacillota bacterium]|jgi:predicted CoA-substrate-specific enzyme activase
MLGLGVDIGSMTTKAAAVDGDRLLASVILPTGSRPAEAARQAYEGVIGRLGAEPTAPTAGSPPPTVATGYGRVTAPFPALAVTEITCHAVGAHWYFPGVGLVIDIGGQDSKTIRVGPGGAVLDFAMNDKCAAGTGRFLEVMARALDVELDQLADYAARARTPTQISNLCTVFAESEVISHLSRGVPKEEIIAGLHKAIANRVYGLVVRVGAKPEHVFTGGVARNQGVARELQALLGGPLAIPPDPQIVGAVGAAVIAAKRAKA